MRRLSSALGFALTFVALHAQQGATVTGKVVNALTGDPIRRANVVLRANPPNQDGPAPNLDSYSTDTDANGSFIFGGVAPGAYVGVPGRDGFAAQPPDHLGPSYYPRFNVETGSRIEGLVLCLMPLGAVAGRILDPEGDPVSGAIVEALQYGYSNSVRRMESSRSTRSDDRGEYRLYGLYPGHYYIKAARAEDSRLFMGRGEVRGARPSLSFAPTFYPAAFDPARASQLDLGGGGELRGIDIRLYRRALFTVSGRISGGTKANAGLSLRLRPHADGTQISGFRLHGDSYEVPDLAPGSYTIIGQRNDPAEGGKPLLARLDVEVADHDIGDADLAFAPGAEISGSVRSAGVAPLSVQSIRVAALPVEEETVPLRVNQGNGRFSSAVKPDGTFAIPNLPPDLYEIRITPANTAYIRTVKMNDQEVGGRRIDLRGGGAAPLAIVVSAEMGRVDGIVKDDQGNAVVGVNVTLNPDESKPDWLEHYRNMITDARGKFFFQNMPPGKYQLFAWRDNPRGAPANREFRKPFEKFAVSVDMEPNGRHTVELKPITTEP